MATFRERVAHSVNHLFFWCICSSGCFPFSFGGNEFGSEFASSCSLLTFYFCPTCSENPETSFVVLYCYSGNLTYDKKGMIDFCCTGLCVDLLKKMTDRMEFNYEMYEVGDQKWGIQNNVSIVLMLSLH